MRRGSHVHLTHMCISHSVFARSMNQIYFTQKQVQSLLHAHEHLLLGWQVVCWQREGWSQSPVFVCVVGSGLRASRDKGSTQIWATASCPSTPLSRRERATAKECFTSLPVLTDWEHLYLILHIPHPIVPHLH